MTPQLVPEPHRATAAQLAGTHLTGEQIGELLAASASNPGPSAALVEAHLLTCERCAAELANLRQSLSLFVQASSAHANNELQRRPQMAVPVRPASPALEPAYWAAAAAVVLAALFPLQTLRQHYAQPPSTAAGIADRLSEPESESDEALLDDVNRDISASVPAPMQALADPTADVASVTDHTSDQTSGQTPVTQGKE